MNSALCMNCPFRAYALALVRILLQYSSTVQYQSLTVWHSSTRVMYSSSLWQSDILLQYSTRVLTSNTWAHHRHETDNFIAPVQKAIRTGVMTGVARFPCGRPCAKGHRVLTCKLPATRERTTARDWQFAWHYTAANKPLPALLALPAVACVACVACTCLHLLVLSCCQAHASLTTTNLQNALLDVVFNESRWTQAVVLKNHIMTKLHSAANMMAQSQSPLFFYVTGPRGAVY